MEQCAQFDPSDNRVLQQEYLLLKKDRDTERTARQAAERERDEARAKVEAIKQLLDEDDTCGIIGGRAKIRKILEG
jgi:hypothetical protein